MYLSRGLYGNYHRDTCQCKGFHTVHKYASLARLQCLTKQPRRNLWIYSLKCWSDQLSYLLFSPSPTPENSEIIIYNHLNNNWHVFTAQEIFLHLIFHAMSRWLSYMSTAFFPVYWQSFLIQMCLHAMVPSYLAHSLFSCFSSLSTVPLLQHKIVFPFSWHEQKL